MSTTWDQHIRTLQALIDAQVPKTQRTATIFPQATTSPQQQPDPTQPWANEAGGGAGFGQMDTAPSQGWQDFAAPSVMALSQSAGINPFAGRALATGIGMVNPAVGMGLGAANLAFNGINTSQNLDMLAGYGVHPSALSQMGGLFGYNPLAGTFQGAKDHAVKERYPGWMGLMTQMPGATTGTQFAGQVADIVSAMDKAAAAQNAASKSGMYAGAPVNTAPLGGVQSEQLGGAGAGIGDLSGMGDLTGLGGLSGLDGLAGANFGFESGGYTGAGADGVVQPWMPAGIVHEGEMVVPAWAVRAGLSPQQWTQFMQAQQQQPNDFQTSGHRYPGDRGLLGAFMDE